MLTSKPCCDFLHANTILNKLFNIEISLSHSHLHRKTGSDFDPGPIEKQPEQNKYLNFQSLVISANQFYFGLEMQGLGLNGCWFSLFIMCK